MNYDLACEYFKGYINKNYDVNDKRIKRKYDSAFHVVDNVKFICEQLKLDKENTDLAMIIALIHDIGRFNQAVEKETFREDITDYDHAAYGIKLLFDDGEIRNYISDSQYDDIIKKVIANHSKYQLEDELNETELLHCKILRDADKINGLRSKVDGDVAIIANIQPEDIENSKISDKVYEDFMNERTILSKDRVTGLDIWVSYIAMIFGLEFKCSFEKIKENGYVEALFDRFDYIEEKEKMKLLKDKALEYLDNHI